MNIGISRDRLAARYKFKLHVCHLAYGMPTFVGMTGRDVVIEKIGSTYSNPFLINLSKTKPIQF